MILASVLSVLISAVVLGVVGVRDPKRLRNAGHGAQAVQALSPATRRICTALILLPGVVLAGVGYWWAFLVWVGIVPALGWVTASLLAR